jgi:hypothetical protein
MNLDSLQPPGDTYVRTHWISEHRVEWARECDRIMMEHGRVFGSRVYRKRRVHERWELAEHADLRDGGWTWSVEYMGRGGR